MPGYPTDGAAFSARKDGVPGTLAASLSLQTGRHYAFDATVMLHEYAHGLADRLVGGPDDDLTLVQPQRDSSLEGFCDFLACSLTSSNTIGSWVLDNPRGMRLFPY